MIGNHFHDIDNADGDGPEPEDGEDTGYTFYGRYSDESGLDDGIAPTEPPPVEDTLPPSDEPDGGEPPEQPAPDEPVD